VRTNLQLGGVSSGTFTALDAASREAVLAALVDDFVASLNGLDTTDFVDAIVNTEGDTITIELVVRGDTDEVTQGIATAIKDADVSAVSLTKTNVALEAAGVQDPARVESASTPEVVETTGPPPPSASSATRTGAGALALLPVVFAALHLV